MESNFTTEIYSTDKKNSETGRSFQNRAFQEIAAQECPPGPTAQAELAAILQCIGTITADGQGELRLLLRSNRPAALTKCFTLLKKTFNITGMSAQEKDTEPGSGGVHGSTHGNQTMYMLTGEPVRRIAQALFLPIGNGQTPCSAGVIAARLLKDSRCVRCALAGQFLGIGTVRDPSREYYLSFDVLSEEQAQQTLTLLKEENLTFRMVQHARRRVIVTRDSDVIVDTLNLLGAPVSMMDMENARIMRQVRGGINRQVNCETANIMKTVAASQRQLEEIRRVRENPVWDTLPESLRQVALLREQYPESSLQELGEMLNPPIGKSGVNHRLRRLSAIAQELDRD